MSGPFAGRSSCIFTYEVMDRFGSRVSLEPYSGRVTLIVNLASMCGLTVMNMKGLLDLADHYQGQPFSILGFPSKSFHQEPKTACEVFDWASANYGLKEGGNFEIFGQVPCKGSRVSGLWLHLKETLGEPKWNYAKFLCDSRGHPIRQYSPHTDPMSLISDIDKLMPRK